MSPIIPIVSCEKLKSFMTASRHAWSIKPKVFLKVDIGDVDILRCVFCIFWDGYDQLDLSNGVSL